jgi:DNA-binding transcriptional LysR family regulator
LPISDSSAALTTMPEIVKLFMAAHPDAEIRLREMHSAEQLEALKLGALDVAILREAVTDSTFA